MNKIVKIEGTAMYLPGDDIDTDRIIPARFLKAITFDGLGENVFIDDRAQAKGQHPFHLPENKGASILVTGANFGCGSSREHAVHALKLWGVQAIIAPSFAGIFRSNSTANGLVCVEVSRLVMDELLNNLASGRRDFSINLERMVAQQHYDDPLYSWVGELTMPESDRQMLTNGTWDSLGTLLEADDLIKKTAQRLPASPIQLAGGSTI